MKYISTSSSSSLLGTLGLGAPAFYFLGYTKYRESIAFAKKIDFQILMNVHVLRATESKKVISVCLSVCLSLSLSVCLSVCLWPP